MRLSAYARDLRGAEKRRYLEKVAQCGGVDPYDYGAGDAALDMTLLPRVEFTDIKDYLVHATSFATREALKAYKSMEGHNYLTSGWVQEPCVKVLADGRRVVLGKVRHSQAFYENALEPWLLVTEDGAVLAAHCTCMAGLGEACSHIAAVLFYVEVVVRRRDGKVCTDEENSWLPPYVQHLEGKRCSQVSFASARAKKNSDGCWSGDPPKQASTESSDRRNNARRVVDVPIHVPQERQPTCSPFFRGAICCGVCPSGPQVPKGSAD